jgi:hypothetical protein
VVYVTAYADEKTVRRAKATDHMAISLSPSMLEVTDAIEIALYKHQMEKKLHERTAVEHDAA